MTKVKVCGITNYKDAVNAADLGADYLGFNFYKRSPRHIGKSKAKNIIEKLPKNAKKVGIFVNESIGSVKSIVEFCRLDLVQLSGDENQEYISKLKNISNKKIIKSFRIKNSSSVKNIKNYETDYVMLDSFKKGFFGGTGIELNLEFIGKLDNGNLFLAGGLNTINVKSAVKKIKPYAVDVCSSIEAHPGRKDFEKMKEFIHQVKLQK